MHSTEFKLIGKVEENVASKVNNRYVWEHGDFVVDGYYYVI